MWKFKHLQTVSRQCTQSSPDDVVMSHKISLKLAHLFIPSKLSFPSLMPTDSRQICEQRHKGKHSVYKCLTIGQLSLVRVYLSELYADN